MHYALVEWVGTGTDIDPFQPTGWDTVEKWSVIDLRPDGAVADGLCLIASSDLIRHPRLSLGDSLDDTPTRQLRTRLGNRLGLTLAARGRIADLLADLLIEHARTDGTRWRPAVPEADGVLRLYLGGLFFERPSVRGGAQARADSFPGATASTSLDATAESTYQWTYITGASNALIQTGSGAITGSNISGGLFRAETTADTGDQYAEIDVSALTTVTGTPFCGPVVRMPTGSSVAATADGYEMMSAGAGANRRNLRKRVDDSVTNLATDGTAPTAPFTLKVTASGSSISGYYNGSLLHGPVTDTAVSSSNVRGGIFATLANASNTLTITEWRFGDGTGPPANITGTAAISAAATITAAGTPTSPGGGVTVATSLLINNVVLYEPSVAGTGGFTVVPTLLTLTVTLHQPTVGRHTSPAGTSPAPYVVKVTDMVGTPETTVTLAIPARITRTLNEPDEASFSFPKPAYTAAQIPVLGTASGVREVQIYRDSDLMFWGPIISADTAGNTGAVDCNAAGVDWYMNRRAIDGARTNLLTNPDFEDDLDGWTVNSLPGFSVAASTTRKVLGTQSLAMFGGDPNAEQWIGQTFFHPSTTIGNLLTLSAWYWIESLTSPNLISPRGRGAYIEYLIDGVVQDYDMIPIDEGISPIGEWSRGEIELWIPPGGAYINVRLYCPHGAIYWDALQLVAMESVSTAGISGSPTTEVDVAKIVPMLVSHVQNTDVGKSDLNVGWSNPGGDTGVTMAKHYQYADHVAFDQAIGEFIDRDDCGDISVEITPNTRTFALHVPRKGVDRSGSVTLTFGGNVADYRFVGDGAGAITRATVLGQGDGPDREEGEYADATAIGGLILQDIRTAPAKTTINSLLPIATDIVSRNGRPERVIEVDVLPTANLIHTLDIGDTVSLTISDGWVSVAAAAFRVVGWDLDCATDVLTLTLNEE